ncbi:MAG: sugar ABC transporter permease [Acholeplasmatales bacterium]|nr:sugar ABC transporter permease [Acholeplasmatales bacterium]
METRQSWKAWIYLAPVLVLLAIFTFYPFFNTILLSFLDGYKMSLAAAAAKKGQSIFQVFNFGVDNYVQVIKGNDEFATGLINTIIITVVTVPVSTLLGLGIAVALNSIKPLKKLFQTIFFLPYVTNAIAIGMVFAMMFNVVGTGTVIDDMGIVNRFLGLFGIDVQYWISIGAPKFNKMFVLCFYIIWNALPFKILIFVGALQSVNKQYYDAAKVDGASRFRIFRKITVPLISPMILYVVITGVIGSFKEYTAVVGIFGENISMYGMSTMVGFIYSSLSNIQTGRAAAGAIVLFLIILVATGVQFLVSKKRVHY